MAILVAWNSRHARNPSLARGAFQSVFLRSIELRCIKDGNAIKNGPHVQASIWHRIIGGSLSVRFAMWISANHAKSHDSQLPHWNTREGFFLEVRGRVTKQDNG